MNRTLADIIAVFGVLFIYEAYLLAMSNGEVKRIKHPWEADRAWETAKEWGWV